MQILFDSIADTLHDTWLMLPLLFAAYCLIEYFERKPESDDSMFWNLQKYGPFFGALIGLLPQCGFSVLAAMLYTQGSITLGTMISVFIATSDEAVPLLISEPDLIPTLGILLVLKLIIAACTGFVVDHFIFRHQRILKFSDMPEEEEEAEEEEDEEAVSSCPCCYPEYPLWQSALIRTLKIYGFVFLTALAFSLLVSWVGEDTLSSWLLQGSFWQIVLAALLGFIPNCAITVILCQLFSAGSLSFASLLAGLITNAGLGLLVLYRYSADKKPVWQTMLIMFITAVLSGFIVSLF